MYIFLVIQSQIQIHRTSNKDKALVRLVKVDYADGTDVLAHLVFDEVAALAGEDELHPQLLVLLGPALGLALALGRLDGDHVGDGALGRVCDHL